MRSHAPNAVAAQKLRPLDELTLTSLREHVHERLRGAIISGAFGNGQRINERAVAAELGISTTPLKEALRRLEVEGLVVTKSRRGIFVTFSASQAQEMWLARAALECIVARFAAERITPAALQSLAECASSMRSATGGGKRAALMRLNTSFHHAIHVASGCSYLTRLIEGQEMYDLATRRTLLADASERRLALEEHLSIFEAIAARDPQAASKAMEAHITRSGQVHLRLAFASRPVEASL